MIAHQWVLENKPPAEGFSKTSGVAIGDLKKWMETPFWHSAVMTAEWEQQKTKRRRKHAPKGKRIPKDLLKQAVWLHLFGRPKPYIGYAVGRSVSTLKAWEKTVAWQDMKEEVLRDKLLMHLLDQGLTIQQVVMKAAERYTR